MRRKAEAWNVLRPRADVEYNGEQCGSGWPVDIELSGDQLLPTLHYVYPGGHHPHLLQEALIRMECFKTES